MDVAIVKNITREGPGLLETLLKEYAISYHIIDLDKGDVFFDALKYKAIIVLGGPDSANDSSKKMQDELKQIKKALEHNMPYFGICLGLQVLVKVSGGKVVKNIIKEIGFKDKDNNFFVMEKESDDPLLKDIAFPRTIFHLHGETVALAKSMQLLASGKWCKNQLVKVQHKAYGIQGHMELTRQMLDEWLRKDTDLLQLDKKQILRDYEEIKEEYEKTGKQLFINFLKIAKLI